MASRPAAGMIPRDLVVQGRSDLAREIAMQRATIAAASGSSIVTRERGR